MIKTLYLFFFVCVFTLGLWACTGKNESFKNLSNAQFEALIKDPSVQLIDVRTVAEYSEGHIPNSLNINIADKDGFSKAVDDLLKKEHEVAVYCRSGRRSRNAAELLSQKGFKVYNLDKGIINWIEEGYNVSQ